MLMLLYACENKEENNREPDDNTYYIIDTWYDNDSIVKHVILVEQNDSLFIEIEQHDGHGKFLDVVKNEMNGLTRYDFENEKGEYFIIEKNGDFGFYDSLGKTREITLEVHPKK